MILPTPALVIASPAQRGAAISWLLRPVGGIAALPSVALLDLGGGHLTSPKPGCREPLAFREGRVGRRAIASVFA